MPVCICLCVYIYIYTYVCTDCLTGARAACGEARAASAGASNHGRAGARWARRHHHQQGTRTQSPHRATLSACSRAPCGGRRVVFRRLHRCTAACVYKSIGPVAGAYNGLLRQLAVAHHSVVPSSVHAWFGVLTVLTLQHLAMRQCAVPALSGPGVPTESLRLLRGCLYIHLSTYLASYPSIHPPIHLSSYPSIYPSIHPSIHLSIHLSVYPSISLSIYLSLCPSIYPYLHPSIHTSIHASECPSSCPAIHLYI
jgi:hypothetical protein